MGVGGESIFGKYLWRVETTELEKGLSLSLSLSFALSVLVERRMFVSGFEYRSGAPGKIAWERWRHRERHTRALKRNVNPGNGRCIVQARKNVRHRRYFRRGE